MADGRRPRVYSTTNKRSSLVWLPAPDYDTAKSLWQDNYVWRPTHIDGTLAFENTSFIHTGATTPGPSTSNKGLQLADDSPLASSQDSDLCPPGDEETTVQMPAELIPAQTLVAESQFGDEGSIPRRSTSKVAVKSPRRMKAIKKRPQTSDAIHPNLTREPVPVQKPKGSGFTCHLSMNLDIEVQIKASLYGTVTLELST